jgi:hypothetical protein
MVKKMAILAAAAGFAAPIVSTVLAPTPAHAFTCLHSGMPCGSDAQCCSGFCNGVVCIG